MKAPTTSSGDLRANTPAGTIARTVRLLAALVDSDDDTSGVGALAAAVSLPVSTVHRLLRLLTEEGMVDRNADTHNYTVGPELYRIAARVVAKVDIVRVIEPRIQELADRFDETVLFGHYSPANKRLAFTARADGRQLLQYRIDLNRPMSLVWGASGKAVLAYLEQRQVQGVLAYEQSLPHNGQSPGGEHPLPDLQTLAAELSTVRDQGYVVSEGEKLHQARGIGVPVFGPQGVIGSITLTSPKARLPHGGITAIADEMKRVAHLISTDLGVARRR